MYLGIVAGLLVAIAIAYVRAALRRRSRSRFAKARAARALAGEAAAEALLADAGYEVTARQARRAWQLRVDGEPLDLELRCDLLASASGRTYVAEVKTGAAAPRLDTAATRRQLLEYQVAYGVDGVLLVDAEAGAVRVIDFPLAIAPPPETQTRRTPWLAFAAIIVGFVLGRLL
ncbi:MAG TPA: PD-(D/E)XK nuclease family protein [Kofleriaceae bacterium]|nr:PD-(D/E)XK nuclease family protein [Kofleriaceae bacterium]